MDIYLSESWINVDEEDILDTESIKPGGKSICHASVQLVSQQHGTIKTAKRSSILADRSPSLTAIF
jgi:hypothetical protein